MIHRFLKYLHLKAIDHAIINGYESLFEKKTDAQDVDILFKANVFLKIEDIIKSFCEAEKYQIVQIYHQEQYAKNIFIFNPETFEMLNLDTYGRLHRKNTTFYAEEEIFNNLKSYGDISILDTRHEFFHYLLKKLDKKNITEETFNYLTKLFNKDEEGCKLQLEQNFNSLGKTVIEAFETGNRNKLIDDGDRLREDVKVNIVPSIGNYIENKLRIIRRIIKPTGIVIAFLGPDGSGKSTIIDGLMNATLPFRKTAYFHLKPIKSNTTNTTTVAPHEYPPYSTLKSYVKLLFFIFQYNYGWIKNIASLKIRSTLVVFDRYYDDLIVDHRRYRYGGSKNIARSIRAFIPKPDLYFILTTDASIIYNRKKEVEPNELNRQIKSYVKLTDGKTHHNVDVNRVPETIIKEVFTILMKKMNERH